MTFLEMSGKPFQKNQNVKDSRKIYENCRKAMNVNGHPQKTYENQQKTKKSIGNQRNSANAHVNHLETIGNL